MTLKWIVSGFFVYKNFHFMRRCLLFISLCLLACTSEKKDAITVGIQPYQGFPTDKTDTIAKVIADFYQVKTIVLPVQALPGSAFTNFKAPRYRADSLIRIQNRQLDASMDYILGLTHRDVCITKYESKGVVKKPAHKYTDFGIMGLAFCPGKSSVVSSFRLQHKNQAVHFSRFKKVAVHEFGHNLGLPHCPNKKCVMTDAVESVSTIDRANMALCAQCQSKI